MGMMRQDELGSCDFVDVLEEAAVVKQPIGVKLRSGEIFIDEVRDVVTVEGADYVDFLVHERVAVRDILAAVPRHLQVRTGLARNKDDGRAKERRQAKQITETP